MEISNSHTYSKNTGRGQSLSKIKHLHVCGKPAAAETALIFRLNKLVKSIGRRLGVDLNPSRQQHQFNYIQQIIFCVRKIERAIRNSLPQVAEDSHSRQTIVAHESLQLRCEVVTFVSRVEEFNSVLDLLHA